MSDDGSAVDRPRHGTLLFAHGARDPRWKLPFEAVRDRVAALRPDGEVALAFLEFMPPTLAQAGEALAAAGCRSVTIVPLFLGAGGHVRKDLPALVAALEARYPAVRWRLVPAVGEAPAVIEAMALAALSAGPLSTGSTAAGVGDGPAAQDDAAPG